MVNHGVFIVQRPGTHNVSLLSSNSDIFLNSQRHFLEEPPRLLNIAIILVPVMRSRHILQVQVPFGLLQPLGEVDSVSPKVVKLTGENHCGRALGYLSVAHKAWEGDGRFLFEIFRSR